MKSASPILSSIAPLAETSEAWIVDIWGVMHNGARAHPAAGEACKRFRARGGIVVLLSNAPRPFAAVVPHMTSLGVDPDAYDTGVTSGDATREMIADWQGRPLLHIGPERDRGLFKGYDVRFASPETAEVVICSGLNDDSKETPANYAGMFEGLLARRVPMICANPDILVERGEHLIYCAGALAADYEAKGGKVIYAGKPYGPIYDRTLREIARLKGRAGCERKHSLHRRRRRDRPQGRPQRRLPLGLHRQPDLSSRRPERAGADQAVCRSRLCTHRCPAGAGVVATFRAVLPAALRPPPHKPRRQADPSRRAWRGLRCFAVSNLSSSASCSLSLILCHSSNAGNDGVG